MWLLEIAINTNIRRVPHPRFLGRVLLCICTWLLEFSNHFALVNIIFRPWNSLVQKQWVVLK